MPSFVGASALENDFGGPYSNYDYPYALEANDAISSLQTSWLPFNSI